MATDTCPHCGEATGILPEHYMQLMICRCPHCGKHMYSTIDVIKGFFWHRSDHRWVNNPDGTSSLVKVQRDE